MGSTQSQEQPEVVKIDRKDIPAEYLNVGVSSDVVKRVNSLSSGNNGDAEKLRAELAKEREEKSKLRDEMARLTELQKRTATNVAAPPPPAISGSDIEERKKIFEDTVERVQQQFFQYHRENVCLDNEKEIMSCLQANPGRVLKCTQLADAYEKCVADFRRQVLKGN